MQNFRALGALRLLLLRIAVEASHANAHTRAIAFFSYIWFKYDILAQNCCKLRSVVVIKLSCQSSAPGFDSPLGIMCDVVCRSWEGNA